LNRAIVEICGSDHDDINVSSRSVGAFFIEMGTDPLEMGTDPKRRVAGMQAIFLMADSGIEA
jgi:hypothetical protein